MSNQKKKYSAGRLIISLQERYFQFKKENKPTHLAKIEDKILEVRIVEETTKCLQVQTGTPLYIDEINQDIFLNEYDQVEEGAGAEWVMMNATGITYWIMKDALIDALPSLKSSCEPVKE